MAKKPIKKDKEGNEIIDLRDKVTVVATKDAKHYEEGKEFMCHPKIAEKLIENGYAKLKTGGKTITPKDDDKADD